MSYVFVIARMDGEGTVHVIFLFQTIYAKDRLRKALLCGTEEKTNKKI
jgi:hypothetical protein